MNFNFKKYGSWRLCQNLNYSTASLGHQEYAMKYLNLIIIVFVLVGCGSNPIEEGSDANELPSSLEEAVDDIVSELSEEDKETVKETSFGDLIRYHHGWGTGIRNSLGLWRGNIELLKSACGSEQCHPDDASMEIIYGVWNILNGNDYRYKPTENSPNKALSRNCNSRFVSRMATPFYALHYASVTLRLAWR